MFAPKHCNLLRNALTVSTFILAFAISAAQAQDATASAAKLAEPAWISESNRQSQVLLEITAKYAPEAAARIGVEGHDGDVLDLKPNIVSRQKADLEAAVAKLGAARDAATDPLLKQDLEILVDAGQQQFDTLAVQNRLIASGNGISPMCGLVSFRSAEAGSSRTACTPPLMTRQAATGSSSTPGPCGTATPAPSVRKSGIHSTR